jgi:hypothetical protein
MLHGGPVACVSGADCARVHVGPFPATSSSACLPQAWCLHQDYSGIVAAVSAQRRASKNPPVPPTPTTPSAPTTPFTHTPPPRPPKSAAVEAAAAAVAAVSMADDASRARDEDLAELFSQVDMQNAAAGVPQEQRLSIVDFAELIQLQQATSSPTSRASSPGSAAVAALIDDDRGEMAFCRDIFDSMERVSPFNVSPFALSLPAYLFSSSSPFWFSSLSLSSSSSSSCSFSLFLSNIFFFFLFFFFFFVFSPTRRWCTPIA